MKNVIIASKNPVKIEVARRAFSAVFPKEEFTFEGVSSVSGVPDQPFDDEVRKGAQNRVRDITSKHPDADFHFAIEGGLYHEKEGLTNRAWIAVQAKDGALFESSTSSFRIPKQVAVDVEAGMELGDADDKFFGGTNSKQAGGCIGYLTEQVIDRTAFNTQAAIIALSELKHRDWYE
jgi:inosine/xanthosine triphosphatase